MGNAHRKVAHNPSQKGPYVPTNFAAIGTTTATSSGNISGTSGLGAKKVVHWDGPGKNSGACKLSVRGVSWCTRRFQLLFSIGGRRSCAGAAAANMLYILVAAASIPSARAAAFSDERETEQQTPCPRFFLFFFIFFFTSYYFVCVYVSACGERGSHVSLPLAAVL